MRHISYEARHRHDERYGSIRRTATVAGTLVAMLGSMGGYAGASVSTDQQDYSPGSVVTISGSNDSTGSPGYVPGNTVQVSATADNGFWADACSATVAPDSTWSCKVTLSSDPQVAVGTYTYVARSTDGDGNPISEVGTFTDSAYKIGGAGLSVTGADCSTGSSPFQAGSTVCTTVSVTGTGSSGNDTVIVDWFAPSSTVPTYSDSHGFSSDGSTTFSHAISSAGTWTVKACSGNNSSCDTLGSHVVFATTTFDVSAGPTKLAFTTDPSSGAVNDCLGPITVQTQDSTSTASNVLADTTVDLSTDGGTTGAGGFFSDSGCTTGINSQVISTGTNSTTFYYQATHRGSGSHVITAADHAGTLTSAMQTETIGLANQATLSVTSPTSGVYNNSYTIQTSGGSGTGALSFDTGTSTACEIDPSDSTKVKITSGTGTCSITATKAADSDYNSQMSDPASVTVEKATPDFGFDLSTLPAKTYGDPSFGVASYTSQPTDDTGTVTFALGTGSEGCTVTAAGEVSITGAATGTSYCVITASLAADDNYNAAGPTSQQFNIAKLTLTVTADDQTINFGAATPTFTVSYSTFAYSDTAASLGGTLTFTFTGTGSTTYGPIATPPTHAGTFSITPGGLTSDNYDISFNPGTFTINKADQTITIVTHAPASATFGSQFTVAATASSGLTVTYSHGGGCTNTGATFTMTSGTTACTVYYDQSGNNDYNAAPQKSETVTAQKLATSLLYTGDTLYTLPTSGSTYSPHYSATLSPTACASGLITYSVVDSNNVPVANPEQLGEGVYTVTASFAGDNNCAPSQDEATLTIGSPGSKATGGGFLTLTGIGRVNFGFVVDAVPNTVGQYKGQFVMVSPDRWRVKGTFGQAANGNYVVTGTSGSGTGTGNVYYWDTTNAVWVPASSGAGVPFTISFTDNGSGKKQTAPDVIGVHVTYDAVANGYAAATFGAFPNFASTAIKGGNITVSGK